MSTMSAVIVWCHIIAAIISIVSDTARLPPEVLSFSESTNIVTQTKVVFVQGPQQHSGHDGNTQRLVPGNPSSYPTYSTSSPEAVYDTIPDYLLEVIQVIDQPDVGGVPPSSDSVYLQPETIILPDVIPEVCGKRMSFDTTDVYLTTDHSSPAGGHHYIQVIDQPDVGGVPPSLDGATICSPRQEKSRTMYRK